MNLSRAGNWRGNYGVTGAPGTPTGLMHEALGGGLGRRLVNVPSSVLIRGLATVLCHE